MNNLRQTTGNLTCETAIQVTTTPGGQKVEHRSKLNLFSIISLSRILLHFAKKLGLALGPFVQDDRNTYYYINGFRYKTYTVKQNPDVLNYPVNDGEKGKSARELFDMALGKVN